jgi:hypothetical protein
MTTTPAPPPAWKPLEVAVRHRQAVQVSYHGRQRVISPHALGWKNNRALLLAYQPAGHTTTTLPGQPHPGWRCMYLDEIEHVAAANPARKWATTDTYNPARPFPAIDHVTLAITPNSANHAS